MLLLGTELLAQAARLLCVCVCVENDAKRLKLENICKPGPRSADSVGQ